MNTLKGDIFRIDSVINRNDVLIVNATVYDKKAPQLLEKGKFELPVSMLPIMTNVDQTYIISNLQDFTTLKKYNVRIDSRLYRISSYSSKSIVLEDVENPDIQNIVIPNSRLPKLNLIQKSLNNAVFNVEDFTFDIITSDKKYTVISRNGYITKISNQLIY